MNEFQGICAHCGEHFIISGKEAENASRLRPAIVEDRNGDCKVIYAEWARCPNRVCRQIMFFRSGTPRVIDSVGIHKLVDISHKMAREKGFHDKKREAGTALMLIVTEVAEAMESVRSGEANYWINDKGKPEGLAAELADVVIRVCDMAGEYGIDLEKAIIDKVNYNASRPRMHGGKTC